MKQPRARTFIETTEKRGTQWCRVAIVTCRECSVNESLNIRAAKALLPPVAIAKKFHQRGWEIGANEHWDVCPACVEKRKIVHKKPDLKIVETIKETEKMKPDLTVVAEAPRAMSREDRRIIFENLNGVYLDEKRGYEAGWSDHKVAYDLGVPRAWVEQVREEMFGPVNTNSDMEEFKKGVAELGAIKAKIDSVVAKVEEFKRLANELELAMWADKIAKLEKLSNEVKKHIP